MATEDMADVSEESKKEHDEMMSKTFASEDAGFNFYNSYALKKRFSVRRSYVVVHQLAV